MLDNEKLFAIQLADNEKKVRDKSLAKIRNYISSRSKTNDLFTEEDFIKLWKGLHYSMWQCDKPVIQEELSDRVCNLLKCFNNNDQQVMLFVKVYFITILREWNGIDKWRMDKFMMMMRSMLRQAMSYLSSKKWNKDLIEEFNKIMLDYPLRINDHSVPDGVSYHITDIYIEELAKFGETLKPVRAIKMLMPFFKLMATSIKKPFVLHIKKRLFEQIIECSDVGIDPEIEDELKEIKAFGLQLEEKEDTSEYILKFDYGLIAKHLYKSATSKECIERNKKTIFDLVKKFKALAKGVYPIDDFNNLPNLYDKNDKKKPVKRLSKKSKKSKKSKISNKEQN